MVTNRKNAQVMAPTPDRQWRLRRTDAGLRLGEIRAFGTDRFTWAELLQAPLSDAQVYVLYFPSRFDLPVDAVATDSLRHFGDATSGKTSVDFWDPRDEHFSEALELFGLETPPGLVLATGLQASGPTPPVRPGVRLAVLHQLHRARPAGRPDADGRGGERSPRDSSAV